MDKLVDLLLALYGPAPYLLIGGILLACGVGLPVPEDITLIAGGLMAYYGVCDLGWIILVSMLGVLSGDLIIFLLGRKYGRVLTKKWFFHKLLPDDRLDAVAQKFQKNGEKLLFFARFMPGLRAPIYFSAGTLHVRPSHFVVYDGLAATISVPLIIGGIYYFGDNLDAVIRVIQRTEHMILVVIALAVLGVAGKWYITHRKLRHASNS